MVAAGARLTCRLLVVVSVPLVRVRAELISRFRASCTVPLALFTVMATKPVPLLTVCTAALPTKATRPLFSVAVPLLVKLPFSCRVAPVPSVRLPPLSMVRFSTG